MKSLEFLDPVITHKLLEGHLDVLSPLLEKQTSFYAAQTCPRCGSTCRTFGAPSQPFTQGEVLPRAYMQCLSCNCEFDPVSKIIFKMGNLATAVEPAYPIIRTED